MNYQKIAPNLLSVMGDYKEQGREGLQPHLHTLGIIADPVQEPRVSVFVRCEAKADFEDLVKRDMTVNQNKGRIRTAFLPLSMLPELSERPAVQQIVAARYLEILMDVAPGKVGIPQFKSTSGLTGRNVIIGIVDSGIDASHPAFKGRILRLWDQTLSGTGVPEGGYGAELLPGSFAASRDIIGHGTHVAGIAAGSDPLYPGIAPGASYVIVKCDLSDTHVADGVSYIFRVAADLDRPAVANLSLGGHYDAHDGSDALSVSLGEHRGAGKVVCCAAGNEGLDNIHAHLKVAAGESSAARFGFSPSSSVVKGELNGWYSATDEYEIAVQSPSGATTTFQGVLTSGIPFRDYGLPEGKVRIISPGPDPGNGDHNFVVQVTPNVLQGDAVWRLLVRGVSVAEGVIDVWIPAGASFVASDASDDMKIGTPGASGNVITVGAYSTKNAWKDVQGLGQSQKLTVGTVCAFSSPGPLRKGSQKPDLVAPGAMIAAPASGQATIDQGWMVAPRFRINGGSSMATPFVSGIVALLLERDPSLDSGSVKSILRNAAGVPGQPAGTFDLKWGFGLINALGL
jgi:subtilisin family serine protease